MTITITQADVLDGLRQAVSSRGASYVYEGPPIPGVVCVYAWETAPGRYQPMCIVGQALNSRGVPLRLMHQLANEESVISLAERLEPYGIAITPEAVRVLSAAQHVQDHTVEDLAPLNFCPGCDDYGPVTDVTWGAALKAAVTQARVNTMETDTQRAAQAFVEQVELLLLGESVLALTAGGVPA